MSDYDVVLEKWNKQISKAIDIDLHATIREGKPPDEAFKIALVALLRAVADAIERTDVKHRQDTYWFPMEFPMRMTLGGDQSLWNFMLSLTLINRLGLEDES